MLPFFWKSQPKCLALGQTQRGTVLVSYLHYKTLDSGINKLLSCRCYWNGKLFWLSTPISRLVCFAPRVKTRRAKYPCVYYANTSASFHCLLHGDLVFKLNPGPVNNADQSASSSNWSSEQKQSSQFSSCLWCLWKSRETKSKTISLRDL